ncbi:hypothetical protein Dimus_008495 [Dionaea muscipula]
MVNKNHKKGRQIANQWVGVAVHTNEETNKTMAESRCNGSKMVESQNKLYASSSFILTKHAMAPTNTRKEDSSNDRAPQPMTLACFKIDGIAILPTTEAPVKNLVAPTQL